MSEIQAVNDVLRALADVRDGPFYNLYVDLPQPVERPPKKIDFRIGRIAFSKHAVAGVTVSLTRSDWIEVWWSLAVETTAEALIISGQVGLDVDEGSVEVYKNSVTLHDPAYILGTIHTMADQVCNERSWITRSWPESNEIVDRGTNLDEIRSS